ncbi:uncharacterized protein CTRU02_208067 [Colletotrichum truncatum]|uniref:Uncharacterized protein n=1 Tax=Colletotrichum truncatum TaxID=5467 RepID=A0ACC3YY90_COLTU|nr:uncharacterized protein CTRU02_10935 [Colletotrichum truncatum]KAF6786437.1 hypothetical protein CTRU02_10935 [Colletotrichum truncatum]
MTPALISLLLLSTPIAADDSGATTGWVTEPDGRGTFGLICSCVLTLTICVWTALHLNVPAARSTVRSRALERAKWVLYGVFAPEIVVATAAAQYIVARWLKREIEKDAAHRGDGKEGKEGLSRHTWDMTQCFYAVMGGFVVDRACYGEEAGVERVTITPEGIRLLSFIGKLPQIHESQIQDKSKADWMAKSLVCIQAGWMVAQVIGRVIERLPVSLLEINTCGHVACAVLLYLLWWSKPLDVLDPTVLADGHGYVVSLMSACSSISAVNGVTDIRCFIYLPSGSVEGPGTAATGDNSVKDTRLLITTHLSIGSPGAMDPSRFLGFDVSDLRPRPTPMTLDSRKRSVPRSGWQYHIDKGKPTVAPECLRTYFAPPYDNLALRHSGIYCRRVFSDVQHSKETYKPIHPSVLAQIAKAAESLWDQCAGRQTYAPYYFTNVPEIGVFLGETDYIMPHIVNLPSLTNLGLGQVNVHRDVLRSVLAMTAAAYGGLHLSGWTDHFPTTVERTLWLVASLIIACSGIMLWVFFLARQAWPRFDVFVSGAAPGTRLSGMSYQKPWMKMVKSWVLVFILVVFAVARVFLVVEAFISLREAPAGLYKTPELSDFFPHFQ